MDLKTYVFKKQLESECLMDLEHTMERYIYKYLAKDTKRFWLQPESNNYIDIHVYNQGMP